MEKYNSFVIVDSILENGRVEHYVDRRISERGRGISEEDINGIKDMHKKELGAEGKKIARTLITIETSVI